jgi:N-acetylmuramoyl-L-alanine amidase
MPMLEVLADSALRKHGWLFITISCVLCTVFSSSNAFAQAEASPTAPSDTPWVVYIGDMPYPVAVKPVFIDNDEIFVGLDVVRILGGSVAYDAANKTVEASLRKRTFLLDVRTRTASLDGAPIAGDDLLLKDNKWYLSAHVWNDWGYRPVWHPNFRAWQIIGEINRFSYNDDSKDFVFEATLPVKVLTSQSYQDKTIELTVLGAFIDEPQTPSYGKAVLGEMHAEFDEMARAVRITMSQRETTGFRVYTNETATFVRVNLRNHFKLADYEKTSSGEIRLKVKFSKPTDVNVMELSNPDRLVLDFPGSIYTDATKHIDIGIGRVKAVRIGQFSEPPNPYIVRVVVDLTRKIGYRVIPSIEKDTYYIQFLERKPGKYAIIVDPGHGGSDPGALSPFTEMTEKELNLDIALRVRNVLEKHGQNVILTRDTDYFIPLSERADVTNRLLPMFFVSIHNNSFQTEEMHGAMTFHYASSIEGRKLATFIQNSIVRKTGALDKGVRTANFYVLRETVVPAVLVECGFMTNRDEEARLRDAEYRQLLAQAIAEGILDYCAEISE